MRSINRPFPIVTLAHNRQTVVGISSLFLHTDETIFPNAKEFRPDRWLQPDSKALEKWLVTFGRGPRSCLGIKYVSHVRTTD
jgi:cytochrome P450